MRNSFHVCIFVPHFIIFLYYYYFVWNYFDKGERLNPFKKSKKRDLIYKNDIGE